MTTLVNQAKAMEYFTNQITNKPPDHQSDGSLKPIKLLQPNTTMNPAIRQEWQEKQQEEAIPWPVPLEPYAYHGVVGEVIKSLFGDDYTDADPAAILITFLACFGSAIDRTAYFEHNGNKHFTSLFVAIVGGTATGAKGGSKAYPFKIFKLIDKTWRAGDGAKTTEGLLYQIRDAEDPPKEGEEADDKFPVFRDMGVDDKRWLIFENEFSALLKTSYLPGSTLSEILRKIWDCEDEIRSCPKNKPIKVTKAHVSVLGHITKEELITVFKKVDLSNGLANRFIWFCSRKSKSLPETIEYPTQQLNSFINTLKNIIEEIRGLGEFEVKFDPEAKILWREIFYTIEKNREEGTIGNVLARDIPQVRRIAMIYALLDGSFEFINVIHLKAALAVWEYAESSVRFIFGSGTTPPPDPISEKILEYLKEINAEATQTEINQKCLGGNKSASEISKSLHVLSELGKISHRVEYLNNTKKTKTWWRISTNQ